MDLKGGSDRGSELPSTPNVSVQYPSNVLRFREWAHEPREENGTNILMPQFPDKDEKGLDGVERQGRNDELIDEEEEDILAKHAF